MIIIKQTIRDNIMKYVVGEITELLIDRVPLIRRRIPSKKKY